MATPTAPEPAEIFIAYSYRLYAAEVYRKPFKELERAFNVRFIFADERITNQALLEKISGMIRAARFSIFDISDWNPNVTLELGIAQGAGRDWYIAIDPDKKGDAPVDLRGIDRIEYRTLDELGVKVSGIVAQRFPPKVEPDPLRTVRERVIEFVSAADRPTALGAIARAAGVDKALAGLVLNQLIAGGQVDRIGWGRGTRYRRHLPPAPIPAPPQTESSQSGDAPTADR